MAGTPRVKLTKKEIWIGVRNILLVVAGCLLLAFGDAVFLTPFNIVSGGVVSVGLIVSHFCGDAVLVNDVVVALTQVILFLLGLFTLGRKFSAHTLVATIAYPLFYALFLRLDVGKPLVDAIVAASSIKGQADTAGILLAGIFGGAFVGAGCAVTFLGNGSTGGFDIVSFLIAKHTPIKQGVSSFCIDTTLILIGVFTMQNYVSAMIGVISAFVAAAMIQFVYVFANSYVIVDIISDKYEEIMDYIHTEMGHGSTLIDSQGGYTGEDRSLLRVCIYQSEMQELKLAIAKMDPKAFVSFTTAKAINGEGFDPLFTKRAKKGSVPPKPKNPAVPPENDEEDIKKDHEGDGK